jgi:hypothetical protein
MSGLTWGISEDFTLIQHTVGEAYSKLDPKRFSGQYEKKGDRNVLET